MMGSMGGAMEPQEIEVELETSDFPDNKAERLSNHWFVASTSVYKVLPAESSGSQTRGI